MAHEDGFEVPRTSWFLKLTILAIVVALSAVGTGFAREAVDTLRLAHDAPTFTTTSGTITRASVRSEGRDQVPEVKYEYTIKERVYQGSNRYTASSYRDSKLASRDSARYKVGQELTVYVDARQPERSVLDRDVPLQRAYVRLGYAALFYGIALFSVITYFRSRKKVRVLAYAKHVERERQERLNEERRLRAMQEKT